MAIREYQVLLVELYRENDCPSDRLFIEKSLMMAFTKEFNSRLGTSFTSEEVADELERLRKNKRRTGGLPKLGRSYMGPKYK
jgi:hypothetical protein